MGSTGSDVERAKPPERHNVNAGEVHDLLRRQVRTAQLVKRPCGSLLCHQDLALLGSTLLQSQFELDRSFVDAPLTRDLLRIKLQAALTSCFQAPITGPLPSRQALLR